ncbi:hypothetical protein DFR28_1221 [Arenicella xantha]|uniref:Uncharacterized protein n=1 Tax=Arenicella xantha TaxID=644221 RepID=A0A395JE53_9GAMM|nr:hypothetical protein DFR28_1221 [Arenicella xantha]
MICIVFVLGVSQFELHKGSSSYTFMQVVGGLLSLLAFVSGFYLWVTGFKRYKHLLGGYSFKWLVYVSLTIISALYMQFKYGKETHDS